MSTWTPAANRKTNTKDSKHNVSVPCPDQTRPQGAVFVVCNNQPCTATAKNGGNCWVMLVCCIHAVEDCCNVCCHLKLTIRQHQHRRLARVTLTPAGGATQLG